MSGAQCRLVRVHCGVLEPLRRASSAWLAIDWCTRPGTLVPEDRSDATFLDDLVVPQGIDARVRRHGVRGRQVDEVFIAGLLLTMCVYGAAGGVHLAPYRRGRVDEEGVDATV